MQIYQTDVCKGMRVGIRMLLRGFGINHRSSSRLKLAWKKAHVDEQILLSGNSGDLHDFHERTWSTLRQLQQLLPSDIFPTDMLSTTVEDSILFCGICRHELLARPGGVSTATEATLKP